MTSRPNVVMIGLDTVRADHLGCYGYGRRTSPHLDDYAASGILFEEAISTHIPTHPGFTTILTGKDVMAHGVVNIGKAMDLPPEVRMLQELLGEHGYRTAAADNMRRWFTRGFEIYRDYAFGGSPHAPWHKVEAVNAVALPLLDELAAGGQPFFFFVHYWDPHTPYLPPAPFDRMFYSAGRDERDPANRGMDPVWAFEPFKDYFASWMGGVTDPEFPIAQYDAEIAYMDVGLRAFFTRLTELGLDDTTLVVIFADHGESLMIHDCYFDHHGLYEDNVHVPLIMRLPGLSGGPRRVPGLVALYDVASTVLGLIGLPALAQREGMNGTSLLPLIEGRTASPHDWLPLTECTWMRKRGVRTPDWKLIVALEPDFHGKPPIELYNLRDDPQELTNLAETNAQMVNTLRARLDEWVARRVRETGKADPMEVHTVAAQRIGPLPAGPVAIPRVEEDKPAQSTAAAKDPLLPHRDPGHGAVTSD
jgi:arylsulfatase A-like enzyme